MNVVEGEMIEYLITNIWCPNWRRLDDCLLVKRGTEKGNELGKFVAGIKFRVTPRTSWTTQVDQLFLCPKSICWSEAYVLLETSVNSPFKSNSLVAWILFQERKTSHVCSCEFLLFVSFYISSSKFSGCVFICYFEFNCCSTVFTVHWIVNPYKISNPIRT